MYQDKVERLREEEIVRKMRQFSEAEDISMRVYIEDKFYEIERDEIPGFIKHSMQVCTKPWPINLYETIFKGRKISLLEGAEKTLLSAIRTLKPVEEQCVLKFYRERKRWDEVCDELNIYVIVLNERIRMSLRKLCHSRALKEHVVFHDVPQEKPVPSDELKEAAVKLVKGIGLPLEFIPTAFLQKYFKVSYPIAYALNLHLQEAL